MVVNKGEIIIVTLQLIKSDGLNVEEDATVSFTVLDSSTNEKVSSKSATYNSTTKSYLGTINPTTEWTDQDVGSYLLVWSVADTDDDFASVYSEPLEVILNEADIAEVTASDVWSYSLSVAPSGSAGDVLENIPGTLTDINTNVLGASANIIEDVAEVNTNVLGVSADVVEVNTNVLGVSADVTEVNTNVLGASANIIEDINNLRTSVLGVSADVADNRELLLRILGLVHENIIIDQTNFDNDGNLIGARLRIFTDSTKSSVLATYQITANSSGPGKFTSWEQIKV